MLTPKLAFRNILAHGQRSRTMLIVVGLVSAVLFLFLSFSDGEIENLKSGVIALNEPATDIVVYGSGFKAANDRGEDWQHLSTRFIEDSSGILAQLRGLPFVKRAVDPTTAMTLDIIAAGKRHENFFMRGVDVEQPYLIKDRLRMSEGSFFDSSNRPQVILHYKTASTVGLRPGDRLRLSGKDLFGQVVSQEATLSGYFMGDQDNPSLGEIGFMNMAAYREVSGLGPAETMSLCVDLKRGTGKEGAIAKLSGWASERGYKLEFWDFADTPRSVRADDLLHTYGLFRTIIEAIVVIVLAIVAFGIMNVVSVNLYDRRREIGTYYCLGSEKAFLGRLYALEIAMLNFAASIAGILTGFGMGSLLNALDIRTETSGMQIAFGGSQFRLGFSIGSAAFIVAAILLVTLITAVSTIGSSLRVPPLAAMQDME